MLRSSKKPNSSAVTLAQVTAAVVRAAIARYLAVFAFKSIIIRQFLASLDVISGKKYDVIVLVDFDNL
jgi:hypothetical protein